MTKFVITEMLRSGVIFIIIMVSLHRVMFLVVHLYSTFSVDPQHFPIGANAYQKLRFFEAVGPHFLSQNGEIWYEGADLGPSHKPNFIFKNRLKGIPFSENLYQKLPISTILGAVSPYFKRDNG